MPCQPNARTTALDRAIEQMRHAAPHVVSRYVAAAAQVFLDNPRAILRVVQDAEKISTEELTIRLETMVANYRRLSQSGDNRWDFNRHTVLQGALDAVRDPAFAAKWEASRREAA